MSNSHFQVVPDGYVGTEVYTLGTTTIGPILTQYGEQRVVIDVLGASVSISNPLPVTLEGSSSVIGHVITDAGSVSTVSGTVTANLGTIAGAATSAKQDTGNTSLASIDGKLGSVGQKTMTASAPVVIASNQSSLPVTVGNFPATQPISGTVTANLGTISTAATSAKQDTGNTSLASIDGKLGSLGQAVMASSAPVTIASNQATFPVTNTAGAKGATTAATITSTANGADHQGLDLVEQFAPSYEDNTNGVAYVMQKAVPTNVGAWSFTSSVSGGVGTAGISVKGSAGRIRSIRVTNANATTGFYLQIFNKASAAINNDVPVDRVFVPSQTIAGQGSSGTQFIDFGNEGLYLGTGISIAASTTVGLLTLIASTDMHFNIKFI